LTDAGQGPAPPGRGAGRGWAGARHPAPLLPPYPLYPLPTRDPNSGIVIEGRFSLGWIGALSPAQLEFVGALLRHRGNVQRLAAELGVAYNTARSRLDDVVAALGGAAEAPSRERPGESPPAAAGRGAAEDGRALSASAILDRLAAGELDFDTALRLLRG
jgi:hypothetical protein